MHLVNNWAGFHDHMSCQKRLAAPGLRNIDSYICSKKLGQSELPQTTWTWRIQPISTPHGHWIVGIEEENVAVHCFTGYKIIKWCLKKQNCGYLLCSDKPTYNLDEIGVSRQGCFSGFLPVLASYMCKWSPNYSCPQQPPNRYNSVFSVVRWCFPQESRSPRYFRHQPLGNQSKRNVRCCLVLFE